MSWETTIGLEIHVQLSTKTKLFSGAPENNFVFVDNWTCISSPIVVSQDTMRPPLKGSDYENQYLLENCDQLAIQ